MKTSIPPGRVRRNRLPGPESSGISTSLFANGSVVVVLLLALGIGGSAETASPGDGCRVPFEGTEFIRSGAIVGTESGVLVSGMRVDALDPAGPLSLDEVATPWLFHETDGGRDLPFRGERMDRVASLAPVAGQDGSYFLVWGETVPPDPAMGPLPRYMSQELWISRKAGDHWTEPKRILRAGNVHWEFGRTIRYTADGTPLAMVGTAERLLLVGIGPVHFGVLPDGLGVVPVPDGASPMLGSFDLGPNGEVEAVLLGETDGDGPRRLLLIHMTSHDLGRTWSEPRTVASWPRTRAWPANLRVHLDGSGVLHALWNTNEEGSGQAPPIRHLFRAPGGEVWEEGGTGPTDGSALRWVSGVDRRGTLTMMEEVLRPTARTLSGLQSRRWADPDGWSEPEFLTPGLQAGYLFDGEGADGTWRIGWIGTTGVDPSPSAAGPPTFRLCVEEP